MRKLQVHNKYYSYEQYKDYSFLSSFFSIHKKGEEQMASNIKGITIEIGGNTTKLETALKNVNK